MQDLPDSTEAQATSVSFEESGRSRFSPFNFLVGFGFGTFLGVALALLAVAMVDSEQPAQSTTVEPDEPVVVAGTVQPTPDTRPRTRTALDVRLGPGNGFAIVGLLARGDAVEVVGRDSEAQWLAIRFPPGSAARGWIPVSAVEPQPEVAALAVAIATPLPRTVATFPVGASGSGGDGPTNGDGGDTPTPNPAGRTPTPNPGPPDLVVTAVRLLPDRRVSVTVANRGPGDLSGFTIFVQVRNLSTKTETVVAPAQTLRAGATLTVMTSSFMVDGEEIVQAIVDPTGGVPEVDKSNNLMQVVLAVPPTITPTPRDPSLVPLS